MSGEKAHWLLRAGKEEQRLPLKPKDPCKLGTDRGRDGDKEEEEMVDGRGGGGGAWEEGEEVGGMDRQRGMRATQISNHLIIRINTQGS